MKDDYKKIYNEAAQRYDIEGMLNGFYRAIDANDDKDEFFKYKTSLLVWGVWQALLRHDGKLALKRIEYMPKIAERIVCKNFYTALAYYELQDWLNAYKYFCEHLNDERWQYNELAWFFLGNVNFKIGNYVKAKENYNMALGIRKSFFECQENMNLLFVENDCLKYMYPWKSYLDLQGGSCYDIPIFINSRDRVNCLSKLIDWLWNNGYHNIFILDNDSTYAPLLEYYKAGDRKYFRVIYLRENMGHAALWVSGMLEKLNIKTPYVYTDSDIVPEETCPSNIIELFYDLLSNCPFLRKVGFALRTDDINCSREESIVKSEATRYEVPVMPDVFVSGIDTTFALYGNHRMYSIDEAIRVKIPGAMAIHLPWYYTYNIPEDEKYYIEHASSSSTFAEWYRNNVK